MTMRMGNSLVDELTRSAVDTELGRWNVGRMRSRASGDSGDDVKKRMEKWNATVDRAQRTRKNTY